MVLYDDLLFTDVLIGAEYDEELSSEQYDKLLEEVKRCSKEGLQSFEKHRHFFSLDYLLYAYISASRGGEETEGLKDALGAYIRGVFQSKKNHRILAKGIKLTSVNRIPLNASLLVKQTEAVIDFDDECEMLMKAMVDNRNNDYSRPVGMTHQKLMKKNREKVKQYCKKYIKK